ncbi:ABC transporter permease [Gemmatimonadota bacterium]
MTANSREGPAFRIPKVFRWLLSAFLSPADRTTVLNDLEELFRHRVDRDGAVLASMWLRRQLRHYPTRLAKERVANLLNSGPQHRESKARPWQMGGSMFSAISRDVRVALRGFKRNPGFVIVATLTLALGIGANTAIFSVVNGVLLEPLPYPEPDKLVAMTMTNEERGDRRGPWSVQNLQDVESESRTFASISGYQWLDYTLTGVGEPELVNTVGVTNGLLETLGIPPMIGRDIRSDETVAGGPSVALLSHSFWQERFGGDASILGQTIQLSDVPFEIVGVAPPGFEFPRHAQLWVPGRWDAQTYPRGRYFLRVVGRLSPNATIEMAQAEVSGVATRLAEEYPQSNGSRGVALFSLTEYTVGDVRLELLIMFGAVGLVLLIACANVANLVLARGSSRVGEMAVRATLGASRGTIVRQLLTESLILSALGAAIGAFLAFWGVEGLRAISPGTVPRLENVAVDITVLSFAACLAVAVAVLFGLAPAFRMAGVSIAGVVRDGRDPEAGLGRRRILRSGLLALEMAISLVLLVGAGLLLKSFAQIRTVDLGFDPHNATQFTLSVPEPRYQAEQTIDFFRSLEERLAALPGVNAIGMNSGSPLGRSHTSIGFDIIGRPPFPSEEQPFFLVRRITPGYFESVRISLLAGRAFNADDRAESPLVTVISQTASEQYFPGIDPIGQQVTFDQGQTIWTVVGVVGDVRSLDVTTETEPEAYFPHAQWSVPTMTVTVRTVARVAGLVPLLRREVAALDPMLPLYRIEPLDRLVDISTGEERFYLFLLGLFAGLAVLLAAVGLYGVVTYIVSRRTREIGIRVALGAKWKDVARLVLWQGMLPTAVGTAMGLLAAFAGTRVLSSLLYQVDPWDAPTFVLGTGVLFGVALLASFFPARAATRIPPTEAMRAE